MEFYKLYYKIHRHTGWYDMMDQIDRICRPEYYAQKREKAQRSLRNFYLGMAAIDGATNGALSRTMNQYRAWDL